jgi:hypothetical protein
MNSRIEGSLTSDERRILTIYSDPSKYGIGRADRLSIQYAVGAGIFVVMCLVDHEPLYVLPVYGVFLVFLIVRLRGAKKIAGVMPSIIAKYEARIAELEGSQHVAPPQMP